MIENSVTLTADEASRLSEALLRRRIELGYRSARSFSTAVGLDARTISALEAARRTAVSRNTLAILEVGLNWEPGYIATLLSMPDPETEDHHHVRVYIASDVEATDEQLRIARQVAQAAFNSTLETLRAGQPI